MYENMVTGVCAAGSIPKFARKDARCVVPAVDIHETDDALVVTVDLPGIGKEDIDIHVEGDVLTIAAGTEQPCPADDIWQDRKQLRYHRQFRLNERIEQGLIQAEVKNGVLTILLPKAGAAEPKQVEGQVA